MLDRVKNLANSNDAKAIAAMGATAGTASSAATATGIGSTLTVATVTSVPKLLVALGLGTTTTVALSVAGVVAAAGLVGYGGWKGVNNSYRRKITLKTHPMSNR